MFVHRFLHSAVVNVKLEESTDFLKEYFFHIFQFCCLSNWHLRQPKPLTVDRASSFASPTIWHDVAKMLMYYVRHMIIDWYDILHGGRRWRECIRYKALKGISKKQDHVCDSSSSTDWKQEKNDWKLLHSRSICVNIFSSRIEFHFFPPEWNKKTSLLELWFHSK